MKRCLVLLFICAGLLLSGCASLMEYNNPERLEQLTGIDKHSTYPAVQRNTFEKVNFIELVDPGNLAPARFKDRWELIDKDTDAGIEAKLSAKYDLALAHFRLRDDITQDEKRRLRNSIQERILSVSVSRCNVFKTYLRRKQADKNFFLGSATTVAAVLGSVLPGADAARYLAGTAGLFSGIRAEYNQAYFASLAAHVIAKGIETRQELVYRRIQTEGQKKDMDAYPLEAAIKDAVYFDGLCSVVVGLDQASASVDATTEPGMEAATRTVLRARLLKEVADMSSDKLLKPDTLNSIGAAGARLGLSLVGSARDVAAVETDLLIVATKMVENINTVADDAAAVIEKTALNQKNELIGKVEDADKKKALSEKGPKEGEIVKKLRPKLTEKLLAPLKLEACYSKLAAGAVEMRLKAAYSLSKANTDAERAKRELELSNAARAIAAANDQLNTKERLVIIEINKYRDERVEAIKKAALTPVDKDNTDEFKELKKQAEADPQAPDVCFGHWR